MAQAKHQICPKCGKEFLLTEANKSYRPFCSKRCKMVDLGQWLDEKYVVEGEQANPNLKTDKKE